MSEYVETGERIVKNKGTIFSGGEKMKMKLKMETNIEYTAFILSSCFFSESRHFNNFIHILYFCFNVCCLSVCLSYIGFYTLYQFFFFKNKEEEIGFSRFIFQLFLCDASRKKKQNMAFGLAFIVNSHFIFIFTHELSLSNLIIYISN